MIQSFGGVSAGENLYRFGLQIGPFIPNNWQIQGWTSVWRDRTGSITSGNLEGFGNGIDIILYGQYRFGHWELRFDAGGRLLIRRKLDIVTENSETHYENRLIIYPFTLSFIRRADILNTFFSPYFGIGGGIYFADWEEKYSYSSGSSYRREWLKGSSAPFGVHFLAGIDYDLWRNLYLQFEYRYSYVDSDWELKDQDTDEREKIRDLDIGGTSLKLGLGYSF
jgi:opacity protein-like surface antigen